MPYYNTQLGIKFFSFVDLAEYDKTVQEYESKLNVPVKDENGKETIKLIGIDGNPTTDDSLFASRQRIMFHLRQLKQAFCQSVKSDEISLINFYNKNTSAMGGMVINYYQLERKYNGLNERFLFKWATISDKQKEYINSPSEETEKAIRAGIDELYDLAVSMKLLLKSMYKLAPQIIVLSICNSFIENGLDIFDDRSAFEDEFMEKITSLNNSLMEYHKKLKKNARQKDVSLMEF